jgi:hypothetical protein
MGPWSLYLHGLEAAFRWGDLHLWQTVLSKDNEHCWPLNREVTAAIEGHAEFQGQ